jgi:hypothetical protein
MTLYFKNDYTVVKIKMFNDSPVMQFDVKLSPLSFNKRGEEVIMSF